MTAQPSHIPPLKIPHNTDQGVKNTLRHWYEHRPKMYAALHEQGILFKMANAAFEATLDDSELIEAELTKKQQYDEATAFVVAQQMVRERYMYLPTEEDVPELMQTESGLYIYEPEQGS